jgi:3-deoxy-manno-octulosonate cytidylyltransferase (CMP-KDO synthetase)
MTSDQHRSGTERVHEVSQSIPADVYINVQGDEPMIRSAHIEALAGLMKNPDIPVGTLKTPASSDDIANPNAVKVVADATGRSLYFSRSTIPHDRDNTQPKYFKHLGIYAYRKPYLEKFVTLPESNLERAERLEQLRFLENGIPIYVAETAYDSIGVDTEQDFLQVSRLLAK